MSERCTKWEGFNEDGTPRAVLAKRDGPFADILQPALVKLARYEDLEEVLYLATKDLRRQMSQ